METNSRFTDAFCRNAVQGFCTLNEVQLQALKSDLALNLSPQGLALCQRHFRAERRDPLVGELRFLSALAERLFRDPTAAFLGELHFEDLDGARIWQDICRQRTALFDASAPTLQGILQTSGRYLDRAGRQPNAKTLRCGPAPELATACRGTAPEIALDINGISAALMPTPARQLSPHAGQILLALTNTNATDLALAVSKFQAAYAAFYPVPIAVIGEEGLGVHLANLPLGAELDILQLPHYNKEMGAPSLLGACRNTVILAVPEATASILLSSEAAPCLIGRLYPHDRIVLKDGITPLLSLPRRFLAVWQGKRMLTLSVPKEETDGPAPEVKICTTSTHLLAGVCAEKSTLTALLTLLHRAFACGATPKETTLAATLTLPRGAEEQALPLLLAYHRFAAELALPTGACCVRESDPNTAPMLTAFLLAPQREAPDGNEVAALATALQSGDFAAVRCAIYG